MLLKPDLQQLNPLDFGYEQDDTSSNAIVPKNNSNIYPPISELTPSCNCKKCTTGRNRMLFILHLSTKQSLCKSI